MWKNHGNISFLMEGCIKINEKAGFDDNAHTKIKEKNGFGPFSTNGDLKLAKSPVAMGNNETIRENIVGMILADIDEQ